MVKIWLLTFKPNIGVITTFPERFVPTGEGMLACVTLRDLMGKMMEEACKDVVIVPMLLPVDENEVEGNTSENARLDKAARGCGEDMKEHFLIFE